MMTLQEPHKSWRKQLDRELNAEEHYYGLDGYFMLCKAELSLEPGIKDGKLCKSYNFRNVMECFGGYVRERYGAFSVYALERWNIRGSADIAKMVLAMMRTGFFRKLGKMSREDLEREIDFEELFVKPYRCRPPFPDVPSLMETEIIK